jgi:hypothetical protein
MSSTPSDIPDRETIRHLAYAEASLMLMESLLLLLIERRVLTPADAIEAVETALEAKKTLAREGTHAHIASVAAGVLSSLANSLAASSR